MGLDLVEFVMEVEARVGLSIPDEELSRWATCGDALAWLRRRRPTEHGCLSQRLFHDLRRSLVRDGLDRRMITPNTRLASLRRSSPHALTIGELCEFDATNEFVRRGSWSRADLWLVLRRVAANQSGWSLRSVRPHTRFSDLFPFG